MTNFIFALNFIICIRVFWSSTTSKEGVADGDYDAIEEQVK
jgi:hypothetical protein